MNTKTWLGLAIAAVVALSTGLAAQAQDGAQDAREATPRAEAADQSVVEGCLVREEDVPGRDPNLIEEAGLFEDFILTDAEVVEGMPDEFGLGGTAATMFQVTGLDESEAEALVGTRVQVTGDFGNVGEAVDPSDDGLTEIEASSIRAAAGGEACN